MVLLSPHPAASSIPLDIVIRCLALDLSGRARFFARGHHIALSEKARLRTHQEAAALAVSKLYTLSPQGSPVGRSASGTNHFQETEF